ncbi:hypothetical protein [Streptacidiphilus jiangxiensis]|uniref:hypothetical protein n=1 Tax=Streptacidiphilus jiangxiensis TaxID=235985 RepID=UPI0009DF47D6|nr:hypothetical protein [Streptacidiphilus jiangxiensis]
MTTVWILMKGERSEGGEVLEVFADRDLALGRFVEEARIVDRTFGIANARQADDGGVHIAGGCDWLSLQPHGVTTRLQLA